MARHEPLDLSLIFRFHELATHGTTNPGGEGRDAAFHDGIRAPLRGWQRSYGQGPVLLVHAQERLLAVRVHFHQRAIDAFLAYVQVRREEYLERMDWLANMGIRRQINPRQGVLLRQALKHPGVGFTAKEVKNLFDVSENTARADLKTLEKLDVLVPHKSGKTVEFLARADAAQRLKSRLKGGRRRP